MEEKEEVKKWIKGVHWLPVTEVLWDKAAEMSFGLRRKGITTSAIDTLIATVAIEHDCLLLHKDSHFELIARHSPLKCF